MTMKSRVEETNGETQQAFATADAALQHVESGVREALLNAFNITYNYMFISPAPHNQILKHGPQTEPTI